jgi:hypothetical protein
MKKTNSIFDGTILAEVETYKGRCKSVYFEEDNSILNPFPIGSMRKPEKILYSLSVLRDKEVGKIIMDFIGKMEEEITEKDFEELLDKLFLKKNARILHKLEKLVCESSCFIEFMWSLIIARYPGLDESVDILRILPGYKIVAGYTNDGASKIYKKSLIGGFDEN